MTFVQLYTNLVIGIEVDIFCVIIFPTLIELCILERRLRSKINGTYVMRTGLWFLKQ
jgi:hypothetical protein